MEVKKLMTTRIETVGPDTPVRDAAQKMKDFNIGAIPVCDGERLVGMLTDRDITVRVTAEGRDAVTTKVRDVMSPHIEWCFEDEKMQTVAAKMEKHKIRRLAVISHDKKLVGMLSLGDLAVRGGGTVACEVLEKVSAPA